MTPLDRKALIETRLQVLSPVFIEIIDESAQHRGHAGAKGGASHFALVIVSEAFTGLSLLARHQKVFACVRDLIPSEVHALKIQAKTPIEVG